MDTTETVPITSTAVGLGKGFFGNVSAFSTFVKKKPQKPQKKNATVLGSQVYQGSGFLDMGHLDGGGAGRVGQQLVCRSGSGNWA